MSLQCSRDRGQVLAEGVVRISAVAFHVCVPVQLTADTDPAEDQFRLAWRHNEPGWPYQLGRFLIDDGRPEDAREFLEVAAGWGDRDASDLLNEIDGVDPADDGT